VGPKGSLDAVAKRKKSPSMPGLESDRPARSLVTILAELSQLIRITHTSRRRSAYVLLLKLIMHFILPENIAHYLLLTRYFAKQRFNVMMCHVINFVPLTGT
jgi:hypothetical protein